MIFLRKAWSGSPWQKLNEVKLMLMRTLISLMREIDSGVLGLHFRIRSVSV